MNWPLLALISMIGGGLMLWRQEAIAAEIFLSLLVPALVFRSWRWNLTAASAVLVCMAWTYQSHWQARVQQPQSVQGLKGWIEGVVDQRGTSQHFSWRVDEPQSPWHGRRMRLSWYQHQANLQAGQCWVFDLKLRPPRGLLNPAGFDYAAWLFRERFVAKASVKAALACGAVSPTARSRAQDHFRTRLDAVAGPARSKATVRALLLGDRSAMTAGDWEDLRRTGTSHLFAISGLHLGLIAGLGWLVGVLCWNAVLYRVWPRRRDLAMLISLAFALGYAWLSGFAIPVQRAFIMYLLGLVLLLGGRQRAPVSVLALAFVIIVVVEPMSLLMPGLWLSFAAVAGILAYLWRFADQPWWQKLLGLQVLLSLLLLPLGQYLFAAVAVFGAPINLLLVPAFSLILPALLVAALALLGGVDQPMQIMLTALDVLWQLLAWLADRPGAYWHVASPSLLLTILATTLVLAFFVWPGRALIARAIMALLFVAFLVPRPAQSLKPGELELWFFDVGQGQSILLRTAQHALLYDAGPAWPGGFDAAERVLLPSLRQLGVKRLDALVISHPDQDHSGGAVTVRAALAVDERWGFQGQACQAGLGWRWDEVQFQWLHPTAAFHGSDNNLSCVLLIETAFGQRALLTGDIEAPVEALMLDDERVRNLDLISIPHHGSHSSSSAAWVQWVSPELAVVQAGFDNRWGHPRDEVRQRYLADGGLIANTATAGAIQVLLGAQRSWQSQVQRAPRLWHFPESDSVGAHVAN